MTHRATCALLLAALLTACTGGNDGPKNHDSTPLEDSGEGLCGYMDVALIYVPPGSFNMGSPADQAGHQEDEQEHQVTLTHGFCIAQHEVTQSIFYRYAGYEPSTHTDCGGFCPVESISWHEAAWFTNALSEAHGLERCYDCDSGGETAYCTRRGSPYECKGFRLPTEAEWEYAARGGETATYPNGGTLEAGDEDNCAGELVLDNGSRLDDVAWYCGNSTDSAHQVAQHVPNPLYLYDTVGNISEWTHDWYGNSYGGDAVNPWGPTNGSWKVLRGGSYSSHPDEVRLSGRGPVSPDHGTERHGIRFVRTWDR
jgi:formylglycine-generating enzyme required for sulfatase activity